MLRDLLYKVNILSIIGNPDIEIKSLQIDSRKITPQTCFFAIKGSNINGHDFIDDAITNGAVAVVCEELPVNIIDGVAYILVQNSSLALGIMSHHFFGSPSSKMKVIGVTGTNGKTTIATLLWQLFTKLGYHCGLISTVQNQIGEKVIPATYTTPNALALNALLSEMQTQECTYVFMECSSHAIHQHRISGIIFTAAIFSNITHDHLDYHKTFEEYIRVKKSWFDQLPATAFAVSNADDKRGKVMLQNSAAKKYYYSLKTLADFKGKILDNDFSGLHMTINDLDVHFKLIGEFNAYNILAVYAVAIGLGEDKFKVLEVLSALQGAPGRFDYITSKKEKVIGIVDYAHTPDALVNVLVTIRNLRKSDTKIITVVGCGGDRDKAKRPVMTEAACQYSDKVILTSDNPRSEDPSLIIKDMETGINVLSKKKCISIIDRAEAIKTAVILSSKEDIVLVAGKGHETYQEIRGNRTPFDDKKVLTEMFELLEK